LLFPTVTVPGMYTRLTRR